MYQVTYIVRDSAHNSLQSIKQVTEIVYIDACFVVVMNYSLTYYLWIRVSLSFKACPGSSSNH